MKPEIWGPHAWFLLHSISLEYPENPTIADKNNMRTFIYSLSNVLPCEKCRVNFQNHLKTKPLSDENLSSRTMFVKWMIDIHNDINKLNNKPEWSYEQCVENFDNKFELGNSTNNINKINNNILYLCILLILIILLIYSTYVFVTNL